MHLNAWDRFQAEHPKTSILLMHLEDNICETVLYYLLYSTKVIDGEKHYYFQFTRGIHGKSKYGKEMDIPESVLDLEGFHPDDFINCKKDTPLWTFLNWYRWHLCTPYTNPWSEHDQAIRAQFECTLKSMYKPKVLPIPSLLPMTSLTETEEGEEKDVQEKEDLVCGDLAPQVDGEKICILT